MVNVKKIIYIFIGDDFGNNDFFLKNIFYILFIII